MRLEITPSPKCVRDYSIGLRLALKAATLANGRPERHSYSHRNTRKLGEATDEAKEVTAEP